MIPRDGVVLRLYSVSQNIICSIYGSRNSTCCRLSIYASIPLRVLFVPRVRAYVVLIAVVMSWYLTDQH
jgi:hypothetical protein